MEILKAHRQWSTRPVAERFWDMREMHQAAQIMHQQGKERVGKLADLRVEAKDEDMFLIGRQGVAAQVSNFAFGQLASSIGAPAAYLRQLPATLAAQNLNHGLKALAEDPTSSDRNLLFNVNGSVVLRAATTVKYSRMWSDEILARLINELPETFRTPRARPAGLVGERTRQATADDVMPGSRIQLGETIAPAGCYLGDRDMFVLAIDTDHFIDDGTDSPLRRGFMLWNSEVGARTIGGTFFRFKDVCGNHIVWGAQDVLEFEHRHIGNVSGKVGESLKDFGLRLKKYADSSVSDEEAKIEMARECILGENKEAVVDAVVAFAKTKKLDRLNKKLLTAAYDKAVEHEAWYGNPRSVYGMVNGITEVSQTVTSHMDDRFDIDAAAGCILADMPF